MKLQLALGMLLAMSAVEAAQMYRWVDERGVTHFSSKRPEQGASSEPELEGGRVGDITDSPSGGDGRFFGGDTRLLQGGWQGCASELCALVKRLDPKCRTSMCSDAKRYSGECRSTACQTNRLVFEREMRERVAAEEALRASPSPRITPEPPRIPESRAAE